jgi:ABC-type proline/glycine betaine transport system permease subunit
VTPAWTVLAWRWPWITMIAAVVLAVSPLGQEVLRGAFVSNEQLTRHLSLFLLAVLSSILVGVALVEWLVRFLWLRRRAKRQAAATLAAGPRNDKTET